MALPQPSFSTPAEPFATPFPETECVRIEDRPGVMAFRAFVLEHQGGGPGSVWRPCSGGRSGHHAGRAWDWSINAQDPDQKARADELIGWLLDNDAELFRRAGLRYLIWNKRQFSSARGHWKPYDGYDEDGACDRVVNGKPACRDPHTSHVHFSFSKEGADGLTSFYDWLGTPGRPVGLPTGKPPNPFASKGAHIGYAVFGAIVGFTGLTLFARRRP